MKIHKRQKAIVGTAIITQLGMIIATRHGKLLNMLRQTNLTPLPETHTEKFLRLPTRQPLKKLPPADNLYEPALYGRELLTGFKEKRAYATMAKTPKQFAHKSHTFYGIYLSNILQDDLL